MEKGNTEILNIIIPIKVIGYKMRKMVRESKKLAHQNMKANGKITSKTEREL